MVVMLVVVTEDSWKSGSWQMGRVCESAFREGVTSGEGGKKGVKGLQPQGSGVVLHVEGDVEAGKGK